MASTTLKQARIRAGLTQAQLAERLGTHQQTVSAWENPRSTRLPRGEDLRRVIEVLGLSDEEAQVVAGVPPVAEDRLEEELLELRRRVARLAEVLDLTSVAVVAQALELRASIDRVLPSTAELREYLERLVQSLGDVLADEGSGEEVPTSGVSRQ